MSKLDDIITRHEHESDAQDRKEARRAMQDRDYLLDMVRKLTESLDWAVGKWLDSPSIDDECPQEIAEILMESRDKVLQGRKP